MLVGERLEDWGGVDGLGVHHVRSALGGFDLNQPHPRYTDVEGLVAGDVILVSEVWVEGLGVESDGRLAGAQLVEERHEPGLGSDVCVRKMVYGCILTILTVLTIFLGTLTSYIRYNRLQVVKGGMTTLTILTIFR